MTDIDLTTFAYIWTATGVLVLPVTLWLTPPFGRHYHPGFGPGMNNRLGWLIMESPAWWFFSWVFFREYSGEQPVALWLWALWMVHYVNRGLIFPFRIHTKGKRIAMVVVLAALVFQLVNAFLNGAALSLANDYTTLWLRRPVFWLGLFLFSGGWLINLSSDQILLRLRSGEDTDYRIPQGGLFRWVSCPNFLGEIVQWAGWAIMCWNVAALSFAVWTVANLLPRALAHHRWYRQQFPDYPPTRKALFPGLL